MSALPELEQMITELKSAGWKQIRMNMWQAPSGAYFRGPFGAWKIMSGTFGAGK